VFAIKLSFSARSHTGHVRRNNEDNLYCAGKFLTPETRDVPFVAGGEADVPCVFAVFDGMGGESMGEFASLTAADSLAEHARKIESASSRDEIDAAVQKFVKDASSAICGAMLERSVRMGTTVALIVISDGVIYPYNLGDSRIYALWNGRMSRLSEEHTLTMQKVKMGLITEEDAKTDRDKNKLTLHLGVFEDEMTIAASAPEPIPLCQGSGANRALLCSDGLTDMVSDARIEEILRDAQNLDDAAGLLVDEALLNGGRDNVTCVIINGGSK